MKGGGTHVARWSANALHAEPAGVAGSHRLKGSAEGGGYPQPLARAEPLLLLGASTCAITPWPLAVQGRLGAVPWISLSSRQQPPRQSLLAGSITTCSGGSTWVISTALCRNIGQFPVSSMAVGSSLAV